MKVVIALLIGLVSVVGAVMTWQAALLEEQATDGDRQAVAETVLQEQNRASVETQLRNEQAAFARYRLNLTNADELEDEADRLATSGNVEEAALLRDEAIGLREVADRLSFLGFSLNAVTVDEDGEIEFDIKDRRRELANADTDAVQVNADQTAAEADARRRQSQRLVGWIIPLVVAVLILTIAQVSRRASVRMAFVGVAAIVFAGSAGVALFGG